MELIDKDAVVAEIENKIKKYTHRGEESDFLQDGNAKYWGGVLSCLNEIRSYLNTLVGINIDLEDEYMVDREIAREKSILDETRVEYFATGNPIIAAYSEDNLRNQFDAGADWMKEQIIKAQKGE